MAESGGRATGGRRRPVPDQLAPPRQARPRLGPGRRGHELRADGPRRSCWPSSAAWPPTSSRRYTAETCDRGGAAAGRRGARRRPLHRDRLDRAHPGRSGLRARAGRRRPASAASPCCSGRASPPATPGALQERTRARAGAHQRLGLRRAGRGRAGALGQRGPLPGGVRRGGDRDRASADTDGTDPRGQPRAVRDARLRRPEELRGEPIWTFVHPDDVPGLWDRTKELLAGERNHMRDGEGLLPRRRRRGLDRPRASP